MQKETAQDRLLKLLQEAAPQPVSGQSLATALGVTTRTIRNYVKQLNAAGYTLTATKAGYQYESGALATTQQLEDDDLTILRVLLYENRQGISKFALADKLHISEATLTRRLKDLNDYIKHHDVQVRSHQNVISLVGSEPAKRHLIYVVISEESQQDILKTVMLSTGQELVLKTILRRTIANHRLHVDTGTFNNILMHLSIAMYRITHAHQLAAQQASGLVEQLTRSGALAIADSVAAAIKSQLQITVAQPEVVNIAMLLQDTLQRQEPESTRLKDLVERRFYLLATVLLTTVDRNYALNLIGDSAFVARFALHIQNLYGRLKADQYPVPPINKAIKKQFPFIYEIAVFVVGQLAEILEMPVPESEIDFIAMHIGTMVMNHQSDATIEMVLVDHNYLNSNAMIQSRLAANFSESLTITDVYQNYRQLPATVDHQYVIGTAEPLPDAQVLAISPFVNQADQEAVKARLEALRARSRSTQLATYIERFLPPTLLFRDQAFDSSEACISWLCDQMRQGGYVDATFKDSVLQREALSSTAFVPDVAVPHPLKPVTAKTTLAILRNQKPMNWQGAYVRVVILLGLSPNDHDAFQVIFDALIDALSDAETVQRIVDAPSYDAVIDIIKASVANS